MLVIACIYHSNIPTCVSASGIWASDCVFCASHVCREAMQLLYVSHADTTLSIVPLESITACVTSSASRSAAFTWLVTRWESSAGMGRIRQILLFLE